jgi:hypothetical protein
VLQPHCDASESVVRQSVEPGGADAEHRRDAGRQRQQVGLRVEPIGDVGVQGPDDPAHAQHVGTVARAGGHNLAAGIAHGLAEVLAAPDLDHGHTFATID